MASANVAWAATRIQPLLGAEDDVELSVSSVDLAVIVDARHELAVVYKLLSSIVRAFKAG